MNRLVSAVSQPTYNVTLFSLSVANGLLMGGGFYYASRKRRPEEMVLSVLVPPVYVGYQLMKNIDFMNENTQISLNVTDKRLTSQTNSKNI